METNRLPLTDLENLEPGCCCPKFEPALWDGLDLRFRDKPFVRCHTRNLLHVPLNMAPVLRRTWSTIKAAGAHDREFAILSDDSSLWRGIHYLTATKDVPGADNVTLSGDFFTNVFEGPYRDAYIWVNEMREFSRRRGGRMGRLFFYYTTCPKCAERSGKNYVVGIAEVI